MSDIEKIQLFESKKVRTVWDDTEEKWYFSVALYMASGWRVFVKY